MWQSLERGYSFAAWLINRWWSYAEFSYYFEDFDANVSDNNLFCANLQNIDVSLLLRRWFVDESLEGHIWSIGNFDGNFFGLYCFLCVNLWIIRVSLLLQWWFVDDSLKKHWWNYEALDANAKDHWSF